MCDLHQCKSDFFSDCPLLWTLWCLFELIRGCVQVDITSRYRIWLLSPTVSPYLIYCRPSTMHICKKKLLFQAKITHLSLYVDALVFVSLSLSLSLSHSLPTTYCAYQLLPFLLRWRCTFYFLLLSALLLSFHVPGSQRCEPVALNASAFLKGTCPPPQPTQNCQALCVCVCARHG